MMIEVLFSSTYTHKYIYWNTVTLISVYHLNRVVKIWLCYSRLYSYVVMTVIFVLNQKLPSFTCKRTTEILLKTSN